MRMRSDKGSATAELAAGLPILVLFLGAGLTAVLAVTAQLRCVDAAREAARTQARGELGVTAGQRAAPGAAVEVSEDGEYVRARVSVRVRPLGDSLPSFIVSADAVAAREPAEGV
ncbi:MAG: pilus assembly protein [Longispora sp.]|nr:pilus assembly protein [Longispora sp. (in: high G+C Gram-positive bacteria)]